ncbi:MAG: DUF1989 domain-containing protein [bacterium]
MTPSSRAPIHLPGGQGIAFSMAKKEQVRIVNIEGSQVVDAWAFVESALSEFLSTEHTRSCLEKLIPGVGDSLYSNLRKPILSIAEDTSPGIHDLLLSACDEQRYALLGHQGYHRNCTDNLRRAMEKLGHEIPEVPSPFNIFENVSIGAGGDLSIEPPVVEAGQSITLSAEQNIILVLSSCPMDIALTNGPDRRAKPARIEFL